MEEYPYDYPYGEYPYGYYIPIYTKDNCPDSLAWSNEFNFCTLECIFPAYSEEQERAYFIVDSVLAVIGFLMCYFYCLTVMLRPISYKFPNNTIPFMVASLMVETLVFFLPLFLGRRYVFCDSNTEIGSKNWACVLSCILYLTGQFCFFQWACIYHIAITCRVYLIKIPKFMNYVFFVLGFFGWNVICLILGFSLDYNAYYPGTLTCFFQESRDFSYGAIIAYFNLLSLIILICILFICYKMIKVKLRTKLLWKTVLFKQGRLFAFWLYLVTFVSIQTALLSEESENTEEVAIAGIEKYIFCVLVAGDDEDCTLDVPVPDFGLVLTDHIITGGLPIITVLIFGFRKETFLFWKEYIQFCFKHKSIPMPFSPSFDPKSTESHISSSIKQDSELHEEKKYEKVANRIKKL